MGADGKGCSELHPKQQCVLEEKLPRSPIGFLLKIRKAFPTVSHLETGLGHPARSRLASLGGTMPRIRAPCGPGGGGLRAMLGSVPLSAPLWL